MGGGHEGWKKGRNVEEGMWRKGMGREKKKTEGRDIMRKRKSREGDT